MELSIFYSWQSDLPKTKRHIATCLNTIAKEPFGEYVIKISSDARNTNGSTNIAESVFQKINQSSIFVADLTIINQESSGRKCCNPNVLIELGYAMNFLGTDNILMLFDTKYGNVEDLPFDIRQNRIIKFNSDKKSEILTNILMSEVHQIIDTINPTIYDYLYSEINNLIISHLMEFTKIFYHDCNCKYRYDYSYFIQKSDAELESDINNNVFLGFELFNNLTIFELEFETFLNQKTNAVYLGENISRILSKITLSMKSITKFLNFEHFFVEVSSLGEEYNIVSAKVLNPYNDDKLVLIKQSGNPLNNQGIVISANYILPNQINKLKGIYRCTNANYFVKVIKNYMAAIVEWSNYTNDSLFIQLKNIQNQSN